MVSSAEAASQWYWLYLSLTIHGSGSRHTLSFTPETRDGWLGASMVDRSSSIEGSHVIDVGRLSSRFITSTPSLPAEPLPPSIGAVSMTHTIGTNRGDTGD